MKAKTYAGRFAHMPNVSTCTGCHRPHGGEVLVVRCGAPRTASAPSTTCPNIHMSTRADGNGKEEGLAKEIAGLADFMPPFKAMRKTSAARRSASLRRPIRPLVFRTQTATQNRYPEDHSVQQISCVHAASVQATYNYSSAGDAYHNGRYVAASLRIHSKAWPRPEDERDCERQGSAIKPQSA